MELVLVSLRWMLVLTRAPVLVQGLISNLQVPTCAKLLFAGLQLAGKALPPVMDILLVSLDVAALRELLSANTTLILPHSDMDRTLVALKNNDVRDLVL